MLKQLNTRLVNTIAENQLLKKDLSILQQKIIRNNQLIDSLNKEIKEISF